MRCFILSFFLLITAFGFCQEPTSGDPTEDKVVIGFPGITTIQLNEIQNEFLKYDQIQDAKFVIGNHNCMLITFDQTKHDFSVYAELLKTIATIYNVDNCYLKRKVAYAEIINNIGTDTVFEVK